jgi:hypothetical protein
VVCINCKIEIPSSSGKCLKCTNDTPERVAIIFDVLQELIFTRTYDRLSSTINSYREIFRNQQFDDDTNDIVYNKSYKKLFDSIAYPFISILLHLDGINLGKSNKQCLWILSCSIIEIPPAIRTHRQNNLVLSMWTANQHPNIELWLDRCFQQLSNLKHKGMTAF